MQKFFICKHCGNIAAVLNKMHAPLSCCGEKMSELVPNTAEAATEKHLPAVTLNGNAVSVNVGSVDHPMTKEHHIGFVYLETENGGQRKNLAVDAAPKAEFCLNGDKAVAVYAYCNLHGMWKTEL